MPQYKTMEDYFCKHGIRAMREELFKLFCIHVYREDVDLKCIDAFMETPFFLLETDGAFFIKEKKYFELKKEGKTQRKYLYEYSHGSCSVDDWIPDIYYSFVD